MFHGGRDDVLAGVAVLVQGKADGPVVAFRPAGGEDELFTLAAERGGNRLACFPMGYCELGLPQPETSVS